MTGAKYPAVHVADDPACPGVTRLSASPDLPRPHVGVLGAIHGNETCGLETIRRLRREAEQGELHVPHGTVVLIHGNPAASEIHARCTDDGEDINRILDFAFVEELPKEAWGPEHYRALELKPVLEGLDALLDLHSASEVTPPFAIINDVPGARELVGRLGIRYVTHAWNELAERVTIGVLARNGKPGISVECGQHDDPTAVQEALRITRRYLEAMHASDGAPHASEETVWLEVTEVLKKPSPSFRFTETIRGLDHLPAGMVVGTDGTVELRLREAAVAVLPNDRVAVGEDLLYLARRRP